MNKAINILILLVLITRSDAIMARGAPDYQNLETQTVRVEQGNINLNVYQVGFSRLDGGGRVVWFDDFREGLNRHGLDSDAGGSLPISDTSPLHMFGFTPTAKLLPVVNGGQSGIYARFTSPLSGKVGIEFGFYLNPNHGQVTSSILASVAHGSVKNYSLTIAETTNAISIGVVGGTQLVFTPSAAGLMENWHLSLKLIIDPSAGAYDKLLFGGSFIDLSAYTAPNGGVYDAGIMYYDFYDTGMSAVLKEPAWIDYVVVTADEP